MLTIKNRVRTELFGLLIACVFLAGCKPPGARALLEGKRLLDKGDYAGAVAELKTATSLLSTNAHAWNYLGLAYHLSGQPAAAETAYSRAVSLDRDLTEAHYNLGSLWLDQNKLEGARTELTAYTLRRPNSVPGLLKLGSVQLRLRDPYAAERTFQEAQRLDAQSAEVWNGLGMARLQQRRFAEAGSCFRNAIKFQPKFAPAVLNLAITEHQYLRNPAAAIETYRQWLALNPSAPNADAVSGIIRQLEKDLALPVRTPATNPTPMTVAAATPPRAAATNPPVAKAPPRAEPVVTNLARSTPTNPAKPVAPSPAPARQVQFATPPPRTNVEIVQVPSEPAIRTAEDAQSPSSATRSTPTVSTSRAPANVTASKPAKRSFLQAINPLGLFKKDEDAPPTSTALPPSGSATSASATPDFSQPAPSVSFLAYSYRNPPAPSRGNRIEAERAFAQGVQAHEARKYSEAVQGYRRATQADPSYYEAYYNLGLAYSAAGNLTAALAAYEGALAAQPDSLDARYNFALVLQQANYIPDAAAQLEKVVARAPGETRAHLALGNLYAQQLHQPAKARLHYNRVLELDPKHPQATTIRFWLAANQ
jgi:Flp pilus assembly protein TadD